jgi:hypothetical protein
MFQSRISLLLALALFLVGLGGTPERKTLLAHYMPWFASKDISGHWGWHWTMDARNPDKTDNQGKREIASHDYPLIGPYDSSDPDLLEYHCLLMKIAGIDGVIIDWYGTNAFRDYGVIHKNTLRLIKSLKSTGLKYAICYDDQSVKHMISGKFIQASQGIDRGKKVMDWLAKHAFSDPAYLTHDDRPLLLVFGPQHFKPTDWQAITRGLTTRPSILTLPHLYHSSFASGAFSWPPVTGNKTIPVKKWKEYLRATKSKHSNSLYLPVAFPGFLDYYEQAGLHPSFGFLDQRGGKTLKESLDIAWANEFPIIQVATWNDFGEGTMIEPTKKHGFSRLKTIRRKVEASMPGRQVAKEKDLNLPLRLYRLRKGNIPPANKEALDQASSSLVGGEYGRAKALLDKLDKK